MPNTPAPRKAAGSPPSRPRPIPPRLKKPPPVVAAPTPGLPGWAKVRLNGCAVPGAVVVLGGAEKVREPREPDPNPPPTRASADQIPGPRGTASGRTTSMATDP